MFQGFIASLQKGFSSLNKEMEHEYHEIVITGPPEAGKRTVIQRLEAYLKMVATDRSRPFGMVQNCRQPDCRCERRHYPCLDLTLRMIALAPPRLGSDDGEHSANSHGICWKSALAIIYVVDTTNFNDELTKDRERDFFHNVMSVAVAGSLPVLILANKRDDPAAAKDLNKLRSNLGLDSILWRNVWRMQGISAYFSPLGIQEGFQWITSGAPSGISKYELLSYKDRCPTVLTVVRTSLLYDTNVQWNFIESKGYKEVTTRKRKDEKFGERSDPDAELQAARGKREKSMTLELFQYLFRLPSDLFFLVWSYLEDRWVVTFGLKGLRRGRLFLFFCCELPQDYRYINVHELVNRDFFAGQFEERNCARKDSKKKIRRGIFRTS